MWLQPRSSPLPRWCLALPGLRSMTAMSCRCRGRGDLLMSTTAGQQRAAHVSAARRRSPDISGDCVRRLSPHRIRPRVRRELEVTSMEIRLLGPVEVRNGSARQAPAGRGERALLALLALSPGQVVATTTLIDALWDPEGLPDDPGNALQLRVSKLRRALAALGAADLLGRDGAGYRLDIDPDSVDVHRFTRLVEAGRRTGDANRAVEAYDAALSLWRGEPLVDFAGEHWTTVETVRLTELRLAAVAERSERLLTLGSYEQVVADLEPIVTEVPTREKLVGQLMTALFNAGRQAEALELFDRTRHVLADELGIDPSRELRGVMEQILRQDPAMTPVPAAGLSGADGAVVGGASRASALPVRRTS